MKRLVLLVEGEGDRLAVPVLVRRLLEEKKAWDCLWLHDKPILTKGIHAITGRREKEWTRLLGVAGYRLAKTGGGVLALIDGDAKTIEGKPFCAGETARLLTERAQSVGAGKTFSLACVFAKQEFESWLAAGIESLAGKPLQPGHRPGVKPLTKYDITDPEAAPRNAKLWMNERMERGYKPTTDQKPLAELVDLSEIRSRKLRSFECLERAIDRLLHAFRTDIHTLSPMPTD